MNEETVKTVKVVIDNQELEVPAGTTILQAARKLGIKIPTLCHHDDLFPAGSCRMCVVEIEGMRNLQTSCAYNITNPMVIKTSSPKLRNTRRQILELLLSEHCGDCFSCQRNGNCELQTLAADHGIDMLRYGRSAEPQHEIDSSSYSIRRDMNKCILCGRCVRSCSELQGIGVLNTIKRGDKTEVATFGKKALSDVSCINCGQCVVRCPTGALTEKSDISEIWRALENPQKHVVIQTAPAPRAGIGECFGLEPGHSLTLEMNSGLRRLGFAKVFDTNFTADLTILEEGTELISRLYGALVKKDAAVVLPQFTSCSPGWIKYIEHYYPQMLPNLSSAKSPQQMFGAVIKTYYADLNKIDPKDIVSVALMPCTAKKFECNRPEMNASGFKDVDFGLTTRELAKMFKELNLDLPKLPKSPFDAPFGQATGSGVIFGATGGVMEAALRTVIEMVTGDKVEQIFSDANIIPVRGFEGVRYIELPINKVGEVPAIIKHLVPDWNWLKGATLKVAICHGIKNAKKVLEDIKNGGKFSECHFIEFMACPGGCLSGGGQPIPTNEEIRAKRAQAIYAEDMNSVVRKSHENPDVLRLYKEFLVDGPCGHKSHKLLHTGYTPRKKM